MEKEKKRIVQATKEGQQYAHNYNLNNPQEYRYPNETKRVKYRVNTDISDSKKVEELYGVNPVSYQNQISQGIKVRKTKEEVLQENMQRSYRIKHKPPVQSKTDPGYESYMLELDPRQQEIDSIQKGMNQFEQAILDERNIDLSDAGQRAMLSMEEKLVQEDCNICSIFSVGDPVKHKEEGLDGEVAFSNDNRVTIIWADRTRERFTLGEAKKYLVNYANYSSDTYVKVDPLNAPPNQKTNIGLSDASQKALDILDDEEQQSIDKDLDFDIEKIKLKRKVGQLEEKLNEVDVQKVKEKAARELVDLMVKKGMLPQDDEEIKKQMFNIMEMDDHGYESFKNVVLATKIKSPVDDVLAILDEDNYDDDIEIEDGREYAKMKEEIKKQSPPVRSVDGIEMGDTSFFESGGLKNFKPRVGGFGKDDGVRTPEPRNVSASKKPKTIEKKSSLDLSGFENLQGLKSPINIPPKEYTPTSKYSDLFEGLNWTTITKSF